VHSFGAGGWLDRGWIACMLYNRKLSLSTVLDATLSAANKDEEKSKTESTSIEEVADKC
jgi:hypothetical protein